MHPLSPAPLAHTCEATPRRERNMVHAWMHAVKKIKAAYKEFSFVSDANGRENKSACPPPPHPKHTHPISFTCTFRPSFLISLSGPCARILRTDSTHPSLEWKGRWAPSLFQSTATGCMPVSADVSHLGRALVYVPRRPRVSSSTRLASTSEKNRRVSVSTSASILTRP